MVSMGFWSSCLLSQAVLVCYNWHGGMSRIDQVCEALDGAYGRKQWTRRFRVLDELIYTILSQNTTATNCDEAFRRLSERFATWEDAKDAPWQEIADAIKVGGLANQKAPRIKRILEEIYERQGNLDLEWIADTPDEETIKYLTAFDGVGRKTAACVLMFGLGRPVFPVDTHVHRVATRLGLIATVSVDKAHDLLQEMVLAHRIYSCHVNMVAHGRQVCHAQRPKCGICVISNECKYHAATSMGDRRD